MNKKVLTLILVIVTATSTNAMAQNIKKWSLRQCIDYAMDNNIQLQKSKISENVAETELKQAKAGLLPNLSGSMTQSLSYRPFQKSSSNFVNGSITSNSSNKTIQNGSYGINANWTVWNDGINTNSIKSKQKEFLHSRHIAHSSRFIRIAGSFVVLSPSPSPHKRPAFLHAAPLALYCSRYSHHAAGRRVCPYNTPQQPVA